MNIEKNTEQKGQKKDKRKATDHDNSNSNTVKRQKQKHQTKEQHEAKPRQEIKERVRHELLESLTRIQLQDLCRAIGPGNFRGFSTASKNQLLDMLIEFPQLSKHLDKVQTMNAERKQDLRASKQSRKQNLKDTALKRQKANELRRSVLQAWKAGDHPLCETYYNLQQGAIYVLTFHLTAILGRFISDALFADANVYIRLAFEVFEVKTPFGHTFPDVTVASRDPAKVIKTAKLRRLPLPDGEPQFDIALLEYNLSLRRARDFKLISWQVEEAFNAVKQTGENNIFMPAVMLTENIMRTLDLQFLDLLIGKEFEATISRDFLHRKPKSEQIDGLAPNVYQDILQPTGFPIRVDPYYLDAPMLEFVCPGRRDDILAQLKLVLLPDVAGVVGDYLNLKAVLPELAGSIYATCAKRDIDYGP